MSLLTKKFFKEEELNGWKYKVITLCGSTKFKDEFLIEQKD